MDENKFLPTLRDEIGGLGPLGNSHNLQEDLEINGEDPAWLLHSLRQMILIRQVEETIAGLVSEQLARCPCHLAIGQEAIPVSLAHLLKRGDRVFGGHRSHAHYLALGGTPFELLAEVLGRYPGCSRGMGGSMHLINQTIGFYGSVPLVGATIPIAVGAGLAAKLDGGNGLAVSIFGDGATEEGVCHESLNLAAAMKLPVIFLCENNLFASHLHITLRQPSDRVARFAEANRIPNWTLDGNDVVALARAFQEAFALARAGEGPAFIEAVTYRWLGHVGHREDLDVGVRRSADLVIWKKRDPIGRLARALIGAHVLSEADYEEMTATIGTLVSQALRAAQEAPFPQAEALLNLVYSEKPL